jgi:ketosteroid isomerase-like protein
MTATEQRNLAIITEICDAFNQHDAEGILKHFTDDADWLLSRGEPAEGRRLIGKAAIRDMLRQRFSAIPDMAWEIHSHWVGGNRGCSEWTVTGTEKNGNRLNWLGCDLWTLNDDGKVVLKDTYWKYAGGES